MNNLVALTETPSLPMDLASKTPRTASSNLDIELIKKSLHQIHIYSVLLKKNSDIKGVNRKRVIHIDSLTLTLLESLKEDPEDQNDDQSTDSDSDLTILTEVTEEEQPRENDDGSEPVMTDEAKESAEILKDQNQTSPQRESRDQIEKTTTEINDILHCLRKSKETKGANRQRVIDVITKTSELTSHFERHLDNSILNYHSRLQQLQQKLMISEALVHSYQKEILDKIHATTKNDIQNRPNSKSSSQPLTNKLLYSEVAQQERLQLPTIILRPKSKTTLKDLKSTLTKKNLPAGSSYNMQLKNQNLELQCPSTETSATLLQTLQKDKEITKHFELKNKPIPRTKFILFGAPSNLSAEDFEETIRLTLGSQEKDFCNVEKLYESKNGLNVIFSTPSTHKQQILNQKSITFGLYPCALKQYLIIKRCQRCQSFTHRTHQCKSKQPYCLTCGQSHLSENCRSRIKSCINCHEFNHLNNAKFTTNHSADSYQCSTYLSYKAESLKKLYSKPTTSSNQG